MKSAKEWAADVVVGPEHLDHWMWAVRVCDDQASVSLIEPSCSDDARDLANDARGIIERLVERVQTDALPQDLMQQIAELADDMDREGDAGITEPDRMYERAVPLLRKLVQR